VCQTKSSRASYARYRRTVADFGFLLGRSALNQARFADTSATANTPQQRNISALSPNKQVEIVELNSMPSMLAKAWFTPIFGSWLSYIGHRLAQKASSLSELHQSLMHEKPYAAFHDISMHLLLWHHVTQCAPN
jgi:hypothetical protein